MTAEVDQAIKEKYLHHQDLQSKIEELSQKWTKHSERIAGLPPIIRPVVRFFNGFRGREGGDRFMSWISEGIATFREVASLIKSNPGKYPLTHLTYSAYTARDLGFPEFTYGFRYQPDGEPLKEPFDQPWLFGGNGILARRAEGNTPLIEIRRNEPPILHLPEKFAFIITKHKVVTEININPDEPDVVYAAWQPEVVYEPHAITIAKDVVIPWKSSIDEVEVFSDTVEITNLRLY
ncbi:MAG: hypothetical protein Q8P92_00270 [Candidatus Daviesbacteria bacterium]|nr:hypothetical protein [Candidatus Daviesbacteria bacterium]